jgi:hypothetical protein
MDNIKLYPKCYKKDWIILKFITKCYRREGIILETFLNYYRMAWKIIRFIQSITEVDILRSIL